MERAVSGDAGPRGRENIGMCRVLPSWPGYAVMAVVPCAVRWPLFDHRNLLEDGESGNGNGNGNADANDIANGDKRRGGMPGFDDIVLLD
ncbi:hypothetical protein NUW54_g12575 [Trametes sanguinea]|uniref:Uncharacterized protein n=1 Tax=Trametes sanguinea TaxID=158606 RepID=A0ACC1MWC6_9APHY|nr:hypothetical protein NUW54_g12575 [Trametes sanguinea]